MLSTAHHVLQSTITIPYKATHQNHPCSIWARMTKGNYQWLFNFTFQLCLEYSYRYERLHKTFTDALPFLADVPRNIDASMEVTEFALAMPDECKINGDPIASYRNYYNSNKSHLFAWKKRETPHWINPNQ